jgi:hypothetical protein
VGFAQKMFGRQSVMVFWVWNSDAEVKDRWTYHAGAQNLSLGLTTRKAGILVDLHAIVLRDSSGQYALCNDVGTRRKP